MRETPCEEPILYRLVYKYVRKKLEVRKVAAAEKRPSSLLLFGLRFYVLGALGCTAAAVAGKKADPNLAPQAMVKT